MKYGIIKVLENGHKEKVLAPANLTAIECYAIVWAMKRIDKLARECDIKTYIVKGVSRSV